VGEERQVLRSETDRKRLVVVVPTERGGNIRIISARRANRVERQSYDNR
jgi:uncharacterized DUF497 family protein